MARPIVKAKLGGRPVNAILDTGAWRSFALRELVARKPKVRLPELTIRLGGKKYRLSEGRVVEGEVRDSRGRSYRYATIVLPVDDLGHENGTKIEILFGALLLQEWGMVIDESTPPPTIDHRTLRRGSRVEL
ncbi:MAG: hypothetical protein HYY13_13880 [Nitrospirae bacterium]|nr:hypothetical protein [Nitrospirota bacterium]